LGKLADNSALTFSTGSGIHKRLASYEENVLVPLSGLNQGTIVKLDSGEVHLATSTGSTQLTLTAGTANAIPRWSTASSKYLPSTTASLGLATDSSSGAVILNGTSTALTVSVPGLIATPVRLSNVVTTFPLRYSTADKEITYSENEYGSGTILTDRRICIVKLGNVWVLANPFVVRALCISYVSYHTVVQLFSPRSLYFFNLGYFVMVCSFALINWASSGIHSW
jgi:hypothetical protein